MEKLLYISMDALFPILFWGNAIALIFLLTYRSNRRAVNDPTALHHLIIARACHTFYYFVASGRDILPDLLSVNVGITLLLVGVYYEALVLLRIVRENTAAIDKLLLCILVVAVVLFNAVEFTAPSGGLRITMASLGNIALMLFPVIRMLRSRDASAITRTTALLFAVFLVCLLMRAWYGLHNQETSILTTHLLHSITFLALLLQLMIALPAYILILKEQSDDALLLMATTDRLTGATNRHAFLNAATAVYKNCWRFRMPLSVLFIDVDYFKSVNDRFGHAFGDRVLTCLASLIDRCLRESDLSCRYGGEEFVVLLPRSDAAVAELVARRILNEARAARFDDQPDFTFTVSIGVACGVPVRGRNFETAVAIADEAMYQAKRDGRDRIVTRALTEACRTHAGGTGGGCHHEGYSRVCTHCESQCPDRDTFTHSGADAKDALLCAPF